MDTKSDVIIVDDKTVSCDGGPGSMGHPRVFLALKDGKTICPYCSKTFMNKEESGAPAQQSSKAKKKK